MIDERDDSTHDIDEPDLNLPPPRFDERATAKAQPVQPIPADRVSAWRKGVAYFNRAFTSSSRALVLVVIAGLMTGTLGGMVWVKERQVTDVSLPANESVSELAPADTPNASQKDEPRAEVFGVTNLQDGNPARQIRKGRSRTKSSRGPRAYRVAVIR
jgi:hypothetical protein